MFVHVSRLIPKPLSRHVKIVWRGAITNHESRINKNLNHVSREKNSPDHVSRKKYREPSNIGCILGESGYSPSEKLGHISLSSEVSCSEVQQSTDLTHILELRTFELYYYFQQIYKDNLHNPCIALANLGGY